MFWIQNKVEEAKLVLFDGENKLIFQPCDSDLSPALSKGEGEFIVCSFPYNGGYLRSITYIRLFSLQEFFYFH